MTEDDFREEQKFTQAWVLSIIYSLWVLSLIVPGWAFLEKKAGLLAAVLPFLVMSVVVLFFKSLTLQTGITGDGIYYRFSPVQRKFRVIKKSAIEKLEVKSYSPLSEYGGWGIRYGKNGWAYSVKGDKGIYITRDSGTHILIGTCKPGEAEVFLRKRGYNVR